MITLLVSILVVCLLIAFEYWIMSLLPIPQPLKNIIIAIIAMLIVFSYFGGGYEYVHHRWLR